MAKEKKIDIPRQWEQLILTRLHGVLLVIGAPDVGKSTFAQYLFQRLCAESDCAAYLDGDPGQSRLGPPTTMTVAVNLNEINPFHPGDSAGGVSLARFPHGGICCRCWLAGRAWFRPRRVLALR
jgi:polynucleotide 5'-kinase involved in rRNA processing